MIILSLRDVYHVYFIIHSKYFAVVDWLQSPKLFFISIWCLSYPENVSNNLLYHWFHGINKLWYTINNPFSRCSSPEWIKKENSVHDYLKMKLLDLILTNLTGGNVKYIAPKCYLLFESICKSKTSVYILKPCWEIVQSFKESLQQGKHVTHLEIFWINNDKTIIEFCFRMMWRITVCSLGGSAWLFTSYSA